MRSPRSLLARLGYEIKRNNCNGKGNKQKNMIFTPFGFWLLRSVKYAFLLIWFFSYGKKNGSLIIEYLFSKKRCKSFRFCKTFSKGHVGSCDHVTLDKKNTWSQHKRQYFTHHVYILNELYHLAKIYIFYLSELGAQIYHEIKYQTHLPET